MPLVKKIETLSRLRAEGILTETEFHAAKQAILEEVPEAEEATSKRPGTAPEIIALLTRCTLPPVAGGGLVYAMGIPAMLSMTLGVTLLAAIVIAQYRQTQG
ncbi:MAG: SHOCT domain-containing protein [Rhodobacterales bacterium]|nr:SHOCT domain-containing protein [Rhodobacterales bacterium]